MIGLFLAVGSLVTLLTFSTPSEEISPSRAVTINGPIDFQGNHGSDIHGIVKHLYAFGEENSKPVTVFLDSPGGLMFEGIPVVGALASLKEKEIKVICVSTGLTASMAAMIFMTCSQKIAYPNAMFLWHYPYVMGFDGKKRFDPEMNKHSLELVAKFLPLPKELIQELMEKEVLLSAQDLKELTTEYGNPDYITIQNPTKRLIEIEDGKNAIKNNR